MRFFIGKYLPYPHVLWLVILCMTGCGFHLRGMVDMPQWLDNVAVVEEGHRELASLLREQLEAYNIKVSSDPALAVYWLMIQSEAFQQQITSVSASTTPRQYQLIYTVHFKLQAKQGKEIVPSSQVVVTRQITVNSDRILGSDEEEDITKQEMRSDAVMQILNRLSRSL